MQIDNCTFSNDDSLLPTHRALDIEIIASGSSVTMEIRNSLFEKNLYTNPLDSALNMRNAVLYVHVTTGSKFRDQPAIVNLSIKGNVLG